MVSYTVEESQDLPSVYNRNGHSKHLNGFAVSNGNHKGNGFTVSNGHSKTTSDTRMTNRQRKILRKLLRDFLLRFLKGSGYGVGVFSIVRLVTSLMRNPFRESLPHVLNGVFSKDCARVAGFFGLYPSLYHMAVDILRETRNQKDGWTYAVSGAVAGLSIAILDESRRKTLAFYALARAMGAGLSTLVTRGHIISVPYFEVWTFCACTGVIVYCVAKQPELLNPGYYRSILKWSREYSDKKLHLLCRTTGDHFVSCSEAGLHDGPCFQHRLIDFVKSLPAFAKLYLPVHLAPVVIFNRNMLLKRPMQVLESVAKNLVISTTFLGLLISLAKLTICILRHWSNRPPPMQAYIPTVAGLVCGLALMLERYSRRKELALFVLPHIFNIMHTAATRSERSKNLKLPHGFTLTFALSMAAIMHAFEREPESLTMLIRGILKFFVGQSQAISKVNSQDTSLKTVI